MKIDSAARRKMLMFVATTLVLSQVADADSFEDGAFDIDFVTVGNAGNKDDINGYGGVNYPYRIAKYEVSREMILFYNNLSGNPAISLADMTNRGGNGPNLPATGISWIEAARFVNWLNTSKGYSVAYKFTGQNDQFLMWSQSDPGYNPANPYRNSNAYYFLPSEDEWYKAAYFNPNSDSVLYWAYPTKSNSTPIPVKSGIQEGTVVYSQDTSTGPADIMNAGGLGPYGTMAQGGNVWERIESDFDAPNDSPVAFHTIRGGYWGNAAKSLLSSNRVSNSRSIASDLAGFRVASILDLPPTDITSKLIKNGGIWSGTVRATNKGSVIFQNVKIVYKRYGKRGLTATTTIRINGKPTSIGVSRYRDNGTLDGELRTNGLLSARVKGNWTASSNVLRSTVSTSGSFQSSKVESKVSMLSNGRIQMTSSTSNKVFASGVLVN